MFDLVLWRFVLNETTVCIKFKSSLFLLHSCVLIFPPQCRRCGWKDRVAQVPRQGGSADRPQCPQLRVELSATRGPVLLCGHAVGHAGWVSVDYCFPSAGLRICMCASVCDVQLCVTRKCVIWRVYLSINILWFGLDLILFAPLFPFLSSLLADLVKDTDATVPFRPVKLKFSN